MFSVVGPDKFSFPSGHTSRACFISLFFIFLYPLFFIFYMPLIAWSISVCLSRVLLRRHHLLDILGGVLLGGFEAVLLSWLWVSEDFAVWVVSWLSDEKLEGGSYHVWEVMRMCLDGEVDSLKRWHFTFHVLLWLMKHSPEAGLFYIVNNMNLPCSGNIYLYSIRSLLLSGISWCVDLKTSTGILEELPASSSGWKSAWK
jgi:hypothetical protein